MHGASPPSPRNPVRYAGYGSRVPPASEDHAKKQEESRTSAVAIQVRQPPPKSFVTGLELERALVSGILGLAIRGLATTMVVMTVFYGLILLYIGIVTEYIWQIQAEVKDRPG